MKDKIGLPGVTVMQPAWRASRFEKEFDEENARTHLANCCGRRVCGVPDYGPRAAAEDASAPAILQMFEASWDTIEDRMADIFEVGYGRMWLPPPQRADSGFSVGYDVFDRFDLGKPRSETLYGTETGFKTMRRCRPPGGRARQHRLHSQSQRLGNRNDANFVSTRRLSRASR